MLYSRAIHTAVLVVLALTVGRVAADEVVFLERGAEWRWLPGTTEASAPDPTSWRAVEFDDAGWDLGSAPFGYGRHGPYGTDLGELEPPMRGTYSSIFLRRTFEIADASRVVEFHVHAEFDDGFILWLGGKEAMRHHVPEDEFVPHDETATLSHTPGEFEDFEIENPGDFLVTGTNTIAVQVFNVTLGSSDLKFDVELIDPLGPDLQPPRVRQVVPAPETVVRKLTQVEVTFNELVVGLDAEDLLVQGNPAVAVTGAGAGPWVFVFPQPDPGPVALSWRTDHGITDIAEAINAFEGGSWGYSFDPTAALPDIVITEVLAANGTGITDEDGEQVDWIEIANRTAEPVDLAGWSLTDDDEDPSRWVFPETSLAPGEHLIVFASGKDRAEGGLPLHTSFKLARGGEWIGLYSPESPRDLVSELDFPEQRFDHSYGSTDAGALGYFETPTPGEPNGVATPFTGFAEDPVFSVTRGLYSEGFPLELATGTPGATILYTLDGSDPLPANGTEYSGAIDVSPTVARGVVMVRASAFADGMLPSRTVTHSYFFPEFVLTQPARPEGLPIRWGSQAADYELNPQITDPDRERALRGLSEVPTISIVTAVDNIFHAQTGFYANAGADPARFERPVSAEFIFPDGTTTQVDCGIRVQGGSSTNNWKSRKVSMRLLFKGDYGATRFRFPLYPGYDVDSFNTLVLDAGMNLTLNHPDHGQRIRSQYVRDQFVADLQNEAGGYGPQGLFVNVYLDGLHWGMYYIHERPDAAWGSELFGGQREGWDSMRHQSNNVVDGTAVAYNQMLGVARAVRDDVPTLLNLESVLELDGFADYMMINLWAGNTDWAHQNWYATRYREGGVWRYHSWDPEHVLKSAGENRITRNDSGGPTEVFQRLRANEEFRLLFADRFHQHVSPGGMLHVDADAPAWDEAHPERNRPAEIYMRRIREIEDVVLLEYARWGDNYRAQTYVYGDWLNELNWVLRSYMPVRTRTVVSQFKSAGLYPRVDAPTPSHLEGEVDPGTTLELTLPDGAEGTTLYTLDGTDPRTFGTGVTAPEAVTYTGAITLDDYAHLKARTLSDGTWSALVDAIYTMSTATQRDLEISEIHYNPAAASAPGEGREEFIEIHNPTAYTIDLSGVELVSGVRFAFGRGDSLGPDGYAVLVDDQAVFEARYPGVPVAGVFAGTLAGGGEKVTLRDAKGDTIVSVDYGDGDFWALGPDGFGWSLVLVDPDRDPDDSRAWRESRDVGGSPGAADPGPLHGALYVNEILAATNQVEIHNASDAPVDVTGWYLSHARDTVDVLKNYRLEGTVPARGHLAFEVPRGRFSVSEHGGAVYLAAADGNGDLTGFISRGSFDALPSWVPYGRHETSTGMDFTALSVSTFGEPNAAPLVLAVVFNEIHYHPPAGGIEFVELFNNRDRSVSVGGWEVSGISAAEGGRFVIPAGTRIPPLGYLLLVPVPPESFPLAPGGEDAVVIGIYSGGLDNSGERLRLWEPAGGGDRRLVDMVRYNDVAPWSTEPDGQGVSLEKIVATDYGNDVAHWGAATVVGGTPGVRNSIGEDPPRGGLQRPGDINQDASLNISDAIALLGHLFQGNPSVLPCGGSIDEPGARLLLDSNGDDGVNLSDAVFVLSHLFGGGPAPVLGVDCVPIDGCPEVCDEFGG